MGGTVRVKAWGTRGTLPNSSKECLKYGGHTSCFTVETDEHRIIFDAGTGLSALEKVLREEGHKKPVHIFISHVHMDHIQGMYLFPTLFCEEAKIHFYGERREGRGLREQIGLVIGPPYWPVGPEDWTADIRWHDMEAGMVCVPEDGVVIRSMRANHPNDGLLYRAEMGGRSVVYGLDCEMNAGIWEEMTAFSSDCDLLITDAFYDPEEYQKFAGRGHSTWKEGLRMARDCRAARLLCSHHGWGKNDGELDEMEREMQSCWTQAKLAREGEEICL